MSAPPLGLYVHLPWCERKCPYCDFNSHAATDIPEERYVACLLEDLRSDLPLVAGRTVETLFIGGGTPSLFSAAAIRRLLQGVATLVPLSPDLEATLEANPGSAEASRFAGFRAAGINRLSLGIQSFDDHMLTTLGRVHNSAQAHRAIAMAREAGFERINLDLMHGLPGQTFERAAADLNAALAHETPHLSWYQLTIEPNTVFHKRPPRLPAEDELSDIQAAGEALLQAAGYRQYEVSAWAKPGFECRHNLNYWTFGDYLGIGAGAHAKITGPDGHITRYHKTRHPADYLGATGGGFNAGVRELDRNDTVGEFMLNALRLNRGFSRELFEARTGLDYGLIEPRLARLCERELLAADGEGIRATALGRRFLDDVVGEFFGG